MDDKEIAALVAALAPVIKGHVEAVAAPLFARLATLEARAPVPGPAGPPGKPGEDGPRIDDIKGFLEQQALVAVSKMTPPKDGRDGVDGKDADAGAITATVLETVLAKVAEIPLPKDGQNGVDGRDGVDGKDADVEAITAAVTGKVMEVVKAIPVPKDGADGRDGKDGANGVGLAGLLIDRDGELVGTLSDGKTQKLGPVVGKDGAPGKDGADGLGFDDLSVEMADDGRTIIHRWERGERVKEARLQLAVVLYRGVYKEDTEYQAGDCTTWAGSSWIAQRESKGEKPGEGNDAWKLSVKRGRDGKDGVMKPLPDKGPVKL